MTQELIADMLGVRREGVTVAAGRLQDAGAISYVRGHIKILDRKRLEETVCECYKVVRDEFDRLAWIDRKSRRLQQASNLSLMKVKQERNVQYKTKKLYYNLSPADSMVMPHEQPDYIFRRLT